ncbi:Uncharacterized protein QTN25_006157 [Entamoeba marina]
MDDLPILSIIAKNWICQIIHSYSTQVHVHNALHKYGNLSNRIFLSVLFAYCNTLFSGLILNMEVTVPLNIIVMHILVALSLEIEPLFDLFQKYIILDDIFLCVKTLRACSGILLVVDSKRLAGKNLIVTCTHSLLNSYGSCLYAMAIKYCLDMRVTVERMYIPWQFVNEIFFIIPLYYLIPYMNIIHKDLFIACLAVVFCYNTVLSNHTGKTMFDPILDALTTKKKEENNEKDAKQKKE